MKLFQIIAQSDHLNNNNNYREVYLINNTNHKLCKLLDLFGIVIFWSFNK